MITFRIFGQILLKETKVPLRNLFVKAFDKDFLFDDLLGSANTGNQGKFEIISDLKDFQEFFDSRPDIYFKIYRSPNGKLIYTTKDAVRWGSGRIEEFEILITAKDYYDPEETVIVLTGDDGQPLKEACIGESLSIEANGLLPIHTYNITLRSKDRELFTSRMITNHRGRLEPTILWPQIGLDDPGSEKRFTVDEALSHWDGASLSLTITTGKEAIFKQDIPISGTLKRPLLLATDAEGRLLNGFEIGTEAIHLTFRNLSFDGPSRIYMVRRQHDWRMGDYFEPTVLSDGRPAILEVDVKAGGRETVVQFAPADVLVAGAYDFIIRPLRYGYEEDELLQIIQNDIVSSRRVTGLVIRENFWTAKPVLGGCVNRIPVSGRLAVGSPYFRYADTFEIGEDIYAALDPGAVDPGNVSKMCALHVIQSKNDAQWADNNLNHLPILGGNQAVQKMKVQPGCINVNKVLVWPGASQVGEYDIVADFGNNTSDAAAFTPDHKYDTPLDIIDGYFTAGFRVVEDPGTMSEFDHAGNYNYIETDVDGMGFSGTVTVQDENTSYYSPGAFSINNLSVPMRAHVYFPSDSAGVTDPAQTSSVRPDYPLIVVVHGNYHNYISYDFLLEHFAKNGFIAASIHLNNNMRGLGRANMFFEHMTVLQYLFGTKMQNNIGLMGHSRGGEGIVKAARINQQQAKGHNINALISLAPTDQYGSEVLEGAWATPYFVLYGSRDGDIDGGIWTSGYTVPQTGFALWDRANGAKKSMAFVYRATHNGFITTNYEADAGDIPDLLPDTEQKKITRSYMNAFFLQYLKNESKWEGMFMGEWQPASVSATDINLYVQYHDPSRKPVDHFEDPVADWQSSSIGGTVDDNNTLPIDPSEGKMHDHASAPGLDPKSPHDTKGMLLQWNNYTGELVFSIPADDKNISGYSNLSFRISQKVDSQLNTANQSQNLRVALKDSLGNERAIRVSALAEIPFPDHRSNHSLSKSAMNTIRIPLKSYTIVCAGAPKVDLTEVVSLSYKFTDKQKGEIEIDDIEFTN